jgi:hypothetical protein
MSNDPTPMPNDQGPSSKEDPGANDPAGAMSNDKGAGARVLAHGQQGESASAPPMGEAEMSNDQCSSSKEAPSTNDPNDQGPSSKEGPSTNDPIPDGGVGPVVPGSAESAARAAEAAEAWARNADYAERWMKEQSGRAGERGDGDPNAQ